jgi:hypothetical protein
MGTVRNLRILRKQLADQIAENEAQRKAIQKDKSIKNNMLMMALIDVGFKLDVALARVETELRYKGE